MKIISMTFGLLLAAVTGTATTHTDVEVSEVRKLDVFSSIEITSVAAIYFTQGDSYSLKIEGNEEYVKTTTTDVKNGRLYIGFKNEKGTKNRNKEVRIYLTAPVLEEVLFTGVGSFNNTTPLNLKDIKFQISGVADVNVKDLICETLTVRLRGVGQAKIHVDCKHLSAAMNGVGEVSLSGTAETADISKGGVGSVNTRKLKIGR